MRLVLCVVSALFLRQASALTACAYRCDPDWAGLDTGACYDGDCPSPDSEDVGNVLCWGLPYQPGPGDILQHDEVPFETEDACNSYLNSWKSGGQRGNATGNLSASGSDKTPYPSRGQVWSTTMGILKECIGVVECKDLVKGMTGKEVQDCLTKCAFEYTEDKLEEWACDYASTQFTGGLADWFCDNALGTIMQPINKFLNKYIEQPVVDVVEKVEDAVASVGRKIANFFHFSLWKEGDVVVV